MKKLCLVLTIILIFALFAGCAQKKVPQVVSSITLPDVALPPEPTPPPVDDTPDASTVDLSALTPEVVTITVDKTQKTLMLYGDDKLLATFDVRVGSVEGKKTKSGDSKTPEGEYYVCTKTKNDDGELFIGISYPNTDDAQAGLESRLISNSTFRSVRDAIADKKTPPWDTELGGKIGFSGTFDKSETTSGNIALTKENIQKLWDFIETGVAVTIKP